MANNFIEGIDVVEFFLNFVKKGGYVTNSLWGCRVLAVLTSVLLLGKDISVVQTPEVAGTGPDPSDFQKSTASLSGEPGNGITAASTEF